jgi:hypothetical protein
VANNEIGFSIKVDGVDRTVKSISELQTTIADLKKEAANLELGSAAFEEATERIRKAQSQFREFRNDTKAKEVKDQFNDLAGGVSSSFDIAETSLKSFGVESVALSKTASTAQGLISAALQFRNLQELKVDASVARRAITEKAAAAGTVLLNAVNKALNITLSLNPIGLIVTALGLLVVGIAMAINPIKKMIASFEGLNKVVEGTVAVFRNVASFLTGGLIDDAATAKTRSNADAMIAALDDVGSAANKSIAEGKRRLSFLEASGASEETILAQRKKINKEEVASRAAAVAELLKLQAIDGELDDEKKKKLVELQESIKDLQNQAAIDQATYDKKQSDKAAEVAKNKADKQKEAQKAEAERAKELLNQLTESNKKTRELQNKAIVDAIKDEEEKARTTLKIQQDTQRAELQIQIDKLAKKKSLTKEELMLQKGLDSQMKALVASQGIETQNLLDQQALVKKEKQAAFDKELLDLQNTFQVNSIARAYERAQAELALSLENQIKEIEQRKLTEDEKAKLIATITAISAQKSADMEKQLSVEKRDFQVGLITDQYAQAKAQADIEMTDKIAAAQQLYGNTVEFEAARTEIVRQNAEARDQIEKAQLTAQLDATASVLGGVGDLFGENTVAFKAFKIAETGISTYSSAVKAYESMVGIPVVGPILAPIAAGLAIATGLKTIAKIVGIGVPKGGAAGGGGGGGDAKPAASKFAAGGLVTGPGSSTSDSIPALLSNGESVINANSTAMFGGVLSQINQAGGGSPIPAQGNQQPIIRTYVVASDMTSQQEADKRIKDISRI